MSTVHYTSMLHHSLLDSDQLHQELLCTTQLLEATVPRFQGLELEGIEWKVSVQNVTIYHYKTRSGIRRKRRIISFAMIESAPSFQAQACCISVFLYFCISLFLYFCISLPDLLYFRPVLTSSGSGRIFMRPRSFSGSNSE